jgi:DNA repair ATPase RecN
VSYSALKNLGNYENEKVHAVATVEEGQDPIAVLNLLKDWVNTQLNVEIQIQDRYRKLDQLVYKIAETERQLETLRARWESARAFLEKHGVDITEPAPFELEF